MENKFGDSFRCSKDDVSIHLPKWIEKEVKIFGTPKMVRFNLAGDNLNVAKALIKFLIDRGSVDLRHRDFTKIEEYEVIGEKDGKMITKKRALPLYTGEQIAAMPLLTVNLEEHAPKKSAAKKIVTAAQIFGAITSGGIKDKAELEAIIAQATAALQTA